MPCVDGKILDFLTGIHSDRNDRAVRKKDMFERAFTLAYKDMSTHTVAYISGTEPFVKRDSQRCANNKKLIKEALREYVKADFLLLSGVTTELQFKKWHERTCDRIVNIKGECVVSGLIAAKGSAPEQPFVLDALIRHKDASITTTFTYGQAQKLVNMMLKYLYIYCKCEGMTELDSVVSFFHVPIDRFVLGEALGREDYKGIPWSRIASYADYQDCQRDIAASSKTKGYSTAFMWELAEWPFK